MTYEHFEGQTIHGCDSVCVLELTVNRTPQVEILGYTQVAYSSNQWPGIYHYYAVDSTLLEPGSITWSCSNPDWVFVPLSDFHCMVIAKSQGTASLSIETNTTNGCNTTVSLEINATNFGVDDEEAMGILLFPNPAQTEVTVSAPGLSHIRVFNVIGRIVKELSIDQLETVRLNVDDLPQGMYFVEIMSSFGRTTRPMTISR